MTLKKHASIIRHYEDCFSRHGDSHLGVDWPNQEDAEKRYKIMLEVIRGPRPQDVLLDFGCGVSHLYEYMLRSSLGQLAYHGLDASKKFCEYSQKKYPNNQYICADILEDQGALGEYDYVVMNGVFTEKRELSFNEMFDYLKDILRVIYPRTRKGLAFNVMSKVVDWERDDLFHVPIDPLVDFLAKELSRNFVVRNDYGLFEYTVYLYRNPINV